jgi:hypothetical protein
VVARKSGGGGSVVVGGGGAQKRMRMRDPSVHNPCREGAPGGIPRARVHARRVSPKGGRAIDAALSAETPSATAAKLSLAIIREVDPPPQTTLEIGANLTVEDVNGMGFSELMAVAKQHGIELPSELSTPPELTPPSL